MTGFKSPWSSKTILTAIAMGVSLLGTIGVKWFTSDANVKHVMDVVDVVITVLGSAGVITFRASATQQVTTDSSKLPVLLPLLILPALLAGTPGCSTLQSALGIQPGQSVVGQTPADRADQALSVYTSTVHELNQLLASGELSHDTAVNVVEPARAAAWAAVTAMSAQAQTSPTQDTQAFEDAAGKFASEIAKLIAAKLAPKTAAAAPKAPVAQPATQPAVAPIGPVEVPL
jgi:uncharacterized membrane protein